MPRRLVIWAVVTLGWMTVGCQYHPHVAESPDVLPAPAPKGFQVSEMRVMTEPPTKYLYAPIRTNFDELAEPASQTIPRLKQLMISGQVQSGGPVVFIYHDPSEDPSEYFDLEMGLPVRAGTKPQPGYEMRSLSAFHCARMIYRGPIKLLPRAYDKLLKMMIAANLVPSEETRENYLVWEDANSLNNVIRIEVGIR